MKDCKQNQIRNPATGRCVSKTGKIGKELLENQKGTKKPTPAKKTKQSPEETLEYEYEWFLENDGQLKFSFIVEAVPMPGKTIDGSVHEWFLEDENAKLVIYPLFRGYVKDIRIHDVRWDGLNPLYEIKFTVHLNENWRVKNLTSSTILDNYNIYNHELHEKNRRKYKKQDKNKRFQVSYKLDSMIMFNTHPEYYQMQRIYIGQNKNHEVKKNSLLKEQITHSRRKTKKSSSEKREEPYFDRTFDFIVKAIPMPGETEDDMVSFDDGVYKWIEENANHIIAPLFGSYAKNIRDVDIVWEGWNPLYKIKFTASVFKGDYIMDYLTSPKILDNYNIYNHELHEKNRKKYKLLTGFNSFQISYELDSMKMYNDPRPHDYKIYIGKDYHEINPDWCTV